MLWKVGGMVASGLAIDFDINDIAYSNRPMETFCKSACVWCGIWVGAEIGTAICPGVGTIIGGIVFGIGTSIIVHSQDDKNGYIRTTNGIVTG
jgi:hypothetical protein